MKLVLVNSLYAPLAVGGAELSVQELAQQSASEGHDVVVVTLRPEGDDREIARPQGRVRVADIQLPGPWVFGASWRSSSALSRMRFHLREAYRPAVMAQVKDVIRDLRPDLVNTHNIAGFGSGIWSDVDSVLVHSMHDYYLLCPRTTMYRSGEQCATSCFDCRVATIPRRHARRRPDAFTAVSKHVLAVHAAAGVVRPSDVGVVIRNSVSVAVSPRELSVIRRIGFMGRLEPGKGLNVLLRALTSRPELGDVELVVAGRGAPEEVDQLERWKARGVSLRFLGYVTPETFLAGVDCVCVPTQWAEAYGRVAAEARMVNLPVIASRTGGLVDALDGYDAAVLVDDFANPEQWADALTRTRLAFRGRRVGLRHRPGISESTHDYLRLFRRLLDARGSSSAMP